MQPRRCTGRNGVLRNFAKFPEKHLCQRLFFNKVKALLKKRLWYRCFPASLLFFLLNVLARTDRSEYDKSIKSINGCNNFLFLQTEYLEKLNQRMDLLYIPKTLIMHCSLLK